VTGYGMGVFDQHAAKLKSSAVSVEVAKERGYVSAAEKKMLQRYGFSGAQRDVLNLCDAVLVIPLHNVQGEWVGAQMRPDVPRAKNGKTLKYESPFGLKMLIDVPPRVRPHLGDPTRALFITEGPLKSDAMVSAGLDAIDFLGCGIGVAPTTTAARSQSPTGKTSRSTTARSTSSSIPTPC
jgi:hypothetical protein